MKQSSIKAGALISYATIFINILISFIYTPWMIHEIGKNNYGIYSLVLAFLSYFLLDFGLGSSISRFIAKYRADNNDEGINRLFSIATIVYLAIDIVVFVVLFVLYFFLSDIFVKLTPEELHTFRHAYIIAAFFSICNFLFQPYTGAMMAFEFFVPLKLLGLAQRLGTVLLISIALFLGGDVYTLVLINGAVALIVSIGKILFLRKNTKVRIQFGSYDHSIARSLFSFSFWIFLISISDRLRLSVVPSILGYTSGAAEIAVFAVARNIEGLIYYFSVALNGLFIPQVARMVKANQDRTEVTRLMVKVGRIQLYIVGFIIVGLFGLGRSFIHLWIGDEYRDSYYIMVALIAPKIISMTQEIGTTLSYVENEVKFNSVIAISTSILCFLLSILLASRMGAIGCGLSVFITLMIELFFLNIFYGQKLHISIVYFFRECHFKILPFLLVALAVLLIAEYHLHIDCWLNLISVGGIYCIFMLLMLYFIAFNAEEKEMFRKMLVKSNMCKRYISKVKRS